MQVLLQALTYHRYSDEPLSVVVILLVRVTLVVAAGWLAGRALARSSAAVQHRVWLLTILGTLIVPLVWALTPAWRVPLVTLEVEAPAVPPGFGATSSSYRSGWPALLVALWVTGTLAALMYTAIGLVSARRLFRASRQCTHEGWLASLSAVERQLHLGCAVELRVTERSISPAVWSFRRVQILLPDDSLAWPAHQRESVLLHELAHVARRDCAWQMIANLACACWWFHPLVWHAARRMRALGELAADDYVIRAGGSAADYAHELLAIATSLGWARLPGPAQTMFHPSHLESRLRAILDPTRRRNDLSVRRSLVSVAAASALVIPLATLTTSKVRAVSAPPEQPAQGSVDVYLQLRVRVPVHPVSLPSEPAPGQPLEQERLRELMKRFQEELKHQEQSKAPVAPVAPPVRFELIPNWDTDRRAERLIPNYQPGMSQVLLAEQPPVQAAAPAVAAEAPSTGVAPPVALAPLAPPTAE